MSRPLALLAAACLLLLGGLGCERGGRAGGLAGSPPPQKAAPAAARWRGPTDGRLTDRQARIYVEIRRELTPASASSPGGGASPEAIRLAGQRGMDAGEYRWVEERVREAVAADFQSNMAQVQQEMLSEQLSVLRRQMETGKKDGGQRQGLAEQLAAIEEAQGQVNEPAGGGASAAAAAYNRDLLRRHQRAPRQPDIKVGAQGLRPASPRGGEGQEAPQP